MSSFLETVGQIFFYFTFSKEQHELFPPRGKFEKIIKELCVVRRNGRKGQGHFLVREWKVVEDSSLRAEGRKGFFGRAAPGGRGFLGGRPRMEEIP